MKIPLARPSADDTEWQAVRDVLESGWWTQGQRVAEFEAAVADYVGARAAVACSSGTAALHIAMLLMSVRPGDEVIVPSYTWIATANVARMVGARPIFADIDPHTLNMDPEDAERRVTARTKGIILVHQFGLPADLDAFAEIARRHDLWLVEDAACALGSAYKGRRVGGHSDLVCFSFHPRKIVSTGEGGMIAISRPDLVPRARSLISHGASMSDRIRDGAGEVSVLRQEMFTEVGFNYRLSDIQAAVGLAQMKKLDALIASRARRAERYDLLLAKVRHLVRPAVPEGVTHNWQSYVVQLQADLPLGLDQVAEDLWRAGVACRPGYMACHVQPVYRALYPDLVLPATETALARALVLPLYPQMTDGEQDYVVEVLKAALSRPRRVPRSDSEPAPTVARQTTRPSPFSFTQTSRKS